MVSPLPFDFEIFCPFSSRNSSKLKPSGGSAPSVVQMRDDSFTESIRSLPDIS